MKKDDTINDLFDFCFVQNQDEIAAINAQYKALQGILKKRAKMSITKEYVVKNINDNTYILNNDSMLYKDLEHAQKIANEANKNADKPSYFVLEAGSIVNKIPELTKEQINDLDFSDGYSNSYVEGVANDIYLTALKIADQQGLLTKEASLALKPDNWIEWEGLIGLTKIGFSFELECYTRGSYDYWYRFKISKNWCGSTESCLNSNGEVIRNLEQAKQYCQNWLDNYLKENNHVN